MSSWSLEHLVVCLFDFFLVGIVFGQLWRFHSLRGPYWSRYNLLNCWNWTHRLSWRGLLLGFVLLLWLLLRLNYWLRHWLSILRLSILRLSSLWLNTLGRIYFGLLLNILWWSLRFRDINWFLYFLNLVVCRWRFINCFLFSFCCCLLEFLLGNKNRLPLILLPVSALVLFSLLWNSCFCLWFWLFIFRLLLWFHILGSILFFLWGFIFLLYCIWIFRDVNRQWLIIPLFWGTSLSSWNILNVLIVARLPLSLWSGAPEFLFGGSTMPSRWFRSPIVRVSFLRFLLGTEFSILLLGL